MLEPERCETVFLCRIIRLAAMILKSYRCFGKIEKPYEAAVTDKKSRMQTHNGDENGCYTEYTTVVQTNDGKRKKIVKTDRSRTFAWNDLNIGDAL